MVDVKYDECKYYLLQAPPDQDLCRCLAVLLHQWLQARLTKAFTSHDGTIRLADDAALLTPFVDIRTGQPRMQFPLTDANLTAFALAMLFIELLDVCLQLLQMMNSVIGDAQRADFTGLLRFDQGSPGPRSRLFPAVGSMDQIS